MLIVPGVAVNTQRRGFPVGGVGDMTLAAFRLQMRAGQSKVGQFMIEGARVQPDDVGAPALMVRMTGCATGIQRNRIAPVVTLPAGHVGGDVIMTIQAQAALLVARKRHVTLIAITFIVGVTGDDFARHYELLEINRRCRRDRATEDHEADHRNDSCRYRHCHDQYMWTARTWASTDRTIMQKNGT